MALDSSSETNQRTLNLNQQVSAADQGIAYAPRTNNSNNTRLVYRGDVTNTTVYQGLGKDDLEAALATTTGSINSAFKPVTDLLNSINSKPTPTSTPGSSFEDALQADLAGRTKLNDLAATDTVKTGLPSNVLKWLLGAVVVLMLFGLLLAFVKHRRTP